MTEFDDRARMSAARLRASVGPVEPRDMTMASSRTKAVAGAAAALVVAAVIAAIVLSTSSHSDRSDDLAAAAPAPAAITPRTFAPTGLGASLSIPSQWTDAPPASGFQFVARGQSPPPGFVGAAARSGFVPVSSAALESSRRQFLTSAGAVIHSSSSGQVDGRPAVQLQYRISGNGVTVDDTEYDIVATNTLTVGASQRQTTYNVVTIVIGTPVGRPDPGLVRWIASTIRVTP